MKNKEVVKQALSTAFSSKTDSFFINKYFSKNYKQEADGKHIDSTEFVKHLEKVKTLAQSVKIEFLQLIEEGNIVFSRHRVTSTMQDNSVNVFIVFAEFHLDEENKISECIELTRLVKGSEKYENLGSDS